MAISDPTKDRDTRYTTPRLTVALKWREKVFTWRD